MAGINKGMLGQVAASMNDRAEVDRPAPGARSSMERRGEGRRRLDAACEIRLDRIVADPNQPREEFDPEALEQLAASLERRGQLQPIRVRWDDAGDRYVVVVGERRWRAARLAGMDAIACVVVSGDASPDDLLEDQLVENALRMDLRPIEQAKAFRALLTSRGWTHRQLAERLHVGHASITKALALLDLPEAVRDQVEQGALPPATAYEISKVGDPDEQRTIVARVVAANLTRAEAAEMVRRKAGKPAKGRGTGKGKARRPTDRVIRTATGPRITLEYRKGLDDALVLAALREAVAQIEQGLQGRGGAAA